MMQTRAILKAVPDADPVFLRIVGSLPLRPEMHALLVVMLPHLYAFFLAKRAAFDGRAWDTLHAAIEKEHGVLAGILGTSP